jgi:hypothetical protein
MNHSRNAPPAGATVVKFDIGRRETMDIHALSGWKASAAASVQGPGRTARVTQRPEPRLSRRQFARAGGTAFVGALGSRLWKPDRLEALSSFAPVPIPGGTPVVGGAYHFFGPAAVDPIDAEPSLITNFNGFMGLAYIDGMVTRTNTSTGEVSRLPFVNSDMRFMQGVFRGTDGRVHQGAFAFV